MKPNYQYKTTKHRRQVNSTYYLGLLNQGKCTRCREQNTSRPGKSICLTCLEDKKIIKRQYQNRKRQEWAKLGLCHRCGDPKPASKPRCLRCYVADKVQYINRQQRKLAQVQP